MSTEEVDEAENEYEELNEPKFKYKRIQNDLAKIFANDAASCVAVHSKFLALGTQRGRVYVFDHAGNKIAGNNIPPHAVDVNHISIDMSGEYLASCANDGKIVVHGLCGNEHGQIVSMDRPVKSVALDPDFSRFGSGQVFVTGDRCLTMHERGLLGANKQSIIYDGRERDGWIHFISWQGIYIAFANETGVRLFDKSQKSIITHVTRRHDLTLRCELYPARVTWLDDRVFAIGWADRVTVCTIKENRAYFGSKDSANKYVEITYMWELPGHFVSGLSYTTATANEGSTRSNLNDMPIWRELVLFCTCKSAKYTETDAELNCGNPAGIPQEDTQKTDGDSNEGDPTVNQPRVLLLEPINLQEYAVLNEDIIEMNKCETSMCHQYHLAGVRDENLYFILSTHDMIQVLPCNADDHVTWLLDNQLFKRALDFAKQHAKQLHKYTVNLVGRKYLDYLIAEKQDFDEAAKLCPEICARRKDVWEEYTSQFERRNQLKKLASYIPVHDPQLEPECYQSILLDFLKDDFIGFKKLVFQWSPDLYRTGALINETLKKLYNNQLANPEHHFVLLSTLALLYTYERNYERAMEIYMKLRDRSVFSLIDRYQLFSLVKDRIQELMAIDTDLAVRLLLENSDSLPASTVMKQLSRQPKLQLAYLDKLFTRGEGQEFADLAISLYAEYNRPRLLPFLRNSEHYKLDKALEICRAKELGPECVFLLGRGGNLKEALKFIIYELKNVHEAIEFCKEHDDRDLWVDLIDYGSSNAEFITELMRNIGTHVDPKLLISKIQPKLSIPGLKQSLIKLLKDYTLQVDLQNGCKSVLYKDSFVTVENLIKMLRTGIRVNQTRTSASSTACKLCGQNLHTTKTMPKSNNDTGCGGDGDLAICRCNRFYHLKCFQENNSQCTFKFNTAQYGI